MKIINNIDPVIFREYDIRAVYGENLNEDVAYTIGKSYGSYIEEKNIIVGHDNRTSSPIIHKALIKGITDSGKNVIDLGLVTTPMFYYAKEKLKIYTGIMITASHCPKEYNGFKISFSKIGNAYGKLIQDFKDYTKNCKFKNGNGCISNYDIKWQYLDLIKNSLDIKKRKRVVVDCGNGTGSIIIKDILDKLNIEYDLLYCDSDPDFPNHHPDPAVKKNMIDLGKRVKELNYDIGIGIDGDADRVGIVDENGNYLTADLVMLIVYRSIVNTMKNKKALYDVKCSRTLIDGLKELGLECNMNRTGNSYCNLAMQGNLDDPKDDYDFGGEFSGHLFFKDKWPGFDDGIYSGLRIVEILSKTDKKISELLNNISKYYSTEEMNKKVTEENKFDIVKEVKNYAKEKGYSIIDIDGVRIEFEDAWALIRASNTGPNLTIRFEAKTKERLEELKVEFIEKIESIINKLNN